MAIFNVITDYGSTFIGGAARTYVWHEDHYTRIDAKYLNEGQRVRFERKYISRTLDEIDALLAVRSDRYRYAKAALFERNESGMHIPKLRCNIIRGIESFSQDLEDRILRSNGADFNIADYRLFTDLVHDVLVRFAASRGLKAPVWETALHWVRGQVVSPANAMFYAALADINPYFMELFHDFNEGGALKDAYEYYMKVRRGLMAWRAPAGATQEAQQGWSDKKIGTLDQERQIVMEELGTDINSQFIDAVVLKVERVRKKKEHGVLKRHSDEPHLFRGIYTGDASEEGVRVVLIDQIDFKSELSGIDFMSQPQAYAGKLKELCVRYGFPIQMMRDYIFRPLDKRDEENIKRDVIEFMDKTLGEAILKPEEIRTTVLNLISKQGIDLDELIIRSLDPVTLARLNTSGKLSDYISHMREFMIADLEATYAHEMAGVMKDAAEHTEQILRNITRSKEIIKHDLTHE